MITVLTLLSHFYEELSDDELFTAFEHLLNSSAIELESQAWIRDADGFSSGLRQLQSINLKDKEHCRD